MKPVLFLQVGQLLDFQTLEFLSSLEGKILDLALRELKIKGSASDVEVALLGAKSKTSSVKNKVSKVASKVSTPKPKKETVKSDDS